MKRYLIKKHCTPIPVEGEEASYGCEHDHYYGKGYKCLSTHALPTDDEIIEYGFEHVQDAMQETMSLSSSIDQEPLHHIWSVQYDVIEVEAERL